MHLNVQSLSVHHCDRSLWSLSFLQMNLLVYSEVCQHGEAFTALPTNVRLQAAVEPLVPQTVVLPRKHLATDFAAKRPLTRVHTLVRLKPGLLGKRLPALEAPKGFGGLVGALVLLQLRQAWEVFVAH